ncbi:MAG: hypothetical protein LIO46_02865 [Clostridiales bacterium]|nr:hypothetical protein [Clostridiales bacterium]
MTILLTDTSGREFTLAPTAYEIQQDTDTPCDSITLQFARQEPLEEIQTIRAYQGQTLVFSGLADSQQQTEGGSGYTAVLRGRSLAAQLVDNECIPCSYQSPCTKDLFLRHAALFGLKNDLPDLSSEYAVHVSAGTSHWSVLSEFIRFLSGETLCVTPEGRLSVHRPTGAGHRLSNTAAGATGYSQAKLSRRRSGAVSHIQYKTDGDYRYHTRSRALEQRGISVRRCLNLANTPAWKRNDVLQTVMDESVKNSFQLTVTLDGSVPIRLMDTAVFESPHLGRFDGLQVQSIRRTGNASGEQIQAALTRREELEAVHDVD